MLAWANVALLLGKSFLAESLAMLRPFPEEDLEALLPLPRFEFLDAEKALGDAEGSFRGAIVGSAVAGVGSSVVGIEGACVN